MAGSHAVPGEVDAGRSSSRRRAPTKALGLSAAFRLRLGPRPPPGAPVPGAVRGEVVPLNAFVVDVEAAPVSLRESRERGADRRPPGARVRNRGAVRSSPRAR